MAKRKSEVQKAAEKAVKKTHTATVVLAVLFFCDRLYRWRDRFYATDEK